MRMSLYQASAGLPPWTCRPMNPQRDEASSVKSSTCTPLIQVWTRGPTATQRMSVDIGRQGLAALAAELEQLVGADLPALEAELDAAGVPWTPGRSIGRK